MVTGLLFGVATMFRFGGGRGRSFRIPSKFSLGKQRCVVIFKNSCCSFEMFTFLYTTQFPTNVKVLVLLCLLYVGILFIIMYT